ncbi:MAG: hypothetical protein RSD35_09225, partial [Oscillospiraceae bacterium]
THRFCTAHATNAHHFRTKHALIDLYTSGFAGKKHLFHNLFRVALTKRTPENVASFFRVFDVRNAYGMSQK